MSLAVPLFPLEEEYKKHSNISPADISMLRAWLKTQPHLPEQYITDLDLILAYYCSDCSTEVTKKLVDLHYSIKTQSKLFKNRHLYDNTYNNMKGFLALPLKHRAHDGSAVLYAKLIDPDVKTFNYCECVRTMELVIDLWQYEDGSWPGFQCCVDMHGVSLAHIAKVDLETLQQLFYFLQEAMLLKIRALHFLNAPSFMEKVLFLIRPFLKKEVLELVHVHQAGHATLERFLPVAALPGDAGGEGDSLQEAVDYMIQKFKDNRPFFEMEMKKRVDESLRSGKRQPTTSIFEGVEGSFKKLDID